MKPLYVVLITAITFLPWSDLSAQVTDSRLREVLESSKAEDVLGSVGNEILAGVSQLDPPGDTAALAAAVRVHFSLDSLIIGVVEYLKADAQPEPFDELHAWLLSDSIRSIEARADSAAAAQSLQEYAQRLQQESPRPELVQSATKLRSWAILREGTN